MIKKLRWLALIPLLLLLLAAAGWWAWQHLPEWIKPRAQALVLEKTGRKLDWKSLELSWAEKKIVVRGLTLAGRAGATADAVTPPTVSIEQIEAIVSVRSWNEKSPIVESLRIDKPIIRVARVGGNQYDFDDVIERIEKAPKTDPVRYAISNIVMANGLIEFDDRPVKARHRAENIQLAIPFVNTMIEPEKAHVAPALSALIDKSPINLKGDLLPFGKQLQGVLSINVTEVAIAKWQNYFPGALQLDFKRGQLNLEGQIKFLPKAEGSLELSGLAQLSQADVNIKRGPPLASALNLTVPLKQFIATVQGNTQSDSHFGVIKATANEFHLQRDANGLMNWTRLWSAPATSNNSTAASPSASSTKSGQKTASSILIIDGVSIQANQFKWLDAQASALPQMNLDELQITSGAYHSNKKDKIDFTIDFKVLEQKTNAANPLVASWKGDYDQASDAVSMNGRLDQLPLSLASAFVKTLGDVDEGPTALQGFADIAGQFAFKASNPGATLRFTGDELTLRSAALVLVKPKTLQPVIVGVNKGFLKGLTIDLANNQFNAKSAEIEALQTNLKHTSSGVQVIGLAMATPAPVPVTVTVTVSASPSSPALETKATNSESPQRVAKVTPPLQWSLDSLRCRSCVVSFYDTVVKPNVKFERSQVNFEVGRIDSKLNQPVQFKFAANSQVDRPWAASLEGKLDLSPLVVTGAVVLANFDVARLEPYYTNALKLRVTRGTASTRGLLDLKLNKAGDLQSLSFVGDLNVGEFQTLEKSSGNEFIRWNLLSIPKIKVQTGGTAPTLIETGMVDINQLYARVLLNEKGELNLRDGIVQTDAKEKGASVAVPTGANSPPAQIRLGGVKMIDSNINFSDQFVKPNYTANLTQLTGEMSALASDAPMPANLKVQGRVDSDAPLTIEGTLNPLAPTALLDLRAQAKAIELTSLSAYSARWAGYAIEKGKLTAKVHYQIDQGRLNARNEILLNQLVLGERIDGPQATRLPVKLAVALLKNSKGEIELDIPISGSLSDPEFSVGPLIWRTFLGLIGRVIMSPFTALAGLGEKGAEELSFIDFPSGSTDLTDDGKAKVATLSKALKERPGLTLDIGGKADEEADRAGLQRVTLDLMLKGVKLQRLTEANPKADTPDLEKLQIGLDERSSLVAQLYKNYNLPNKPKNILGIEKAVDTDEQQRLLQESISIPADLVKQLAGRRGAVTREFLMQEIPGDRLFVIAPKVVSDSAASAQNRRVEFALR